MEMLLKLSRQDIGHVTDFVRGPLQRWSLPQLADQFVGGRGEQPGVCVDVAIGRSRAHQRHAVGRRDQDAAVGQVLVSAGCLMADGLSACRPRLAR
jgi:hypothetical protein